MFTCGSLLLALAFLSMPLAAQSLTFSKHIAPIIFDHCAPCHRTGEAAPFSLLTYDDVRKHGTQIAPVTQQRYMPPWMPEPGHGDFTASLRLSDQQIDLLARWVHQGMGKLEEALPHFRRAVELEPDNANILTNLGAELASGDLTGAVPVFERALKVDPSNAVARDNLARARRSLEGKQ